MGGCATPKAALMGAEEVGKEVGSGVTGVASDSSWCSLSAADDMAGMDTARFSMRCATSVALHRPRSSVHSPVMPSATCNATTHRVKRQPPVSHATTECRVGLSGR
jgi:hypothetical protein